MIKELLTRRAHGEFNEEMQFHVERSTQANIAAGMSQQEARRQALIAFGAVERAREECHKQRPGWRVETAIQDIRYALRGFRRNPGFTVTVILTLALGVGATTAVFSVVDRILFRSLPYAHADRLVSVGLVTSLEKQEFTVGGFYYDWRDNQKPFAAITFEKGVDECNLTGESPDHLSCAEVAGNFLPALGISPILGRNFLPEEDRPNGPKAALISYGLWLRRYDRDPGILNKLIEIDGSPVRVIGVLPKDFEMPRLQAADIVLPAADDEAQERASNAGSLRWTFARLKSGVSIRQAEAMLRPEFEYVLNQAPPAFRKDIHLRIRSLRDLQMQDASQVAWLLLGAALAVLLIACANVGSLLMARGQAREWELAMRSVLGASRGRLIRQMWTEALLLAFAGAIAGCILAEILLHVFIAIAPVSLPFLSKARLDFRIILFAIFVSLLCAAVFWLLLALQKPHATSITARLPRSSSHAFMRRGLVVGQIAISMVLLSSAMLLLRSFRKLQEQDLGVQTQGVLTANISRSPKATAQKEMVFFEKVEAAVRRIPGVTAVGMSDSLPPRGWNRKSYWGRMAFFGRPDAIADNAITVVSRWVTPDYFHVLDIPIVRGSNFTEEERNSNGHFIILNKLLASRVFPGQDPVGEHVKPDLGEDGPWYTVVGVAANVKNAGLSGEDEPEYYRLRRNFAEDWSDESRSPVMILATTLSPQATALWARSQISQIDPTDPVDIEMLTQQVSALADRPRFATALLGFFAVTGLMMAMIGLYGVISFLAMQRIQEIGIRVALGAGRFDILRLIALEGLRLIVLGGIVGLIVALGISRVFKSLLFNIGPHDPISFMCVALLLSIVALAATLIPARSAMKVDPMVALRYE